MDPRLQRLSHEQNKLGAHNGIRCDSCKISPIMGTRYHCLMCDDYDLCSTCESNNTQGKVHCKNHLFVKIDIPLPSKCAIRSMINPYFDPQQLIPGAVFATSKIYCNACYEETLECIIVAMMGKCSNGNCTNDVSSSALKYCDCCSLDLYVCHRCGKNVRKD